MNPWNLPDFRLPFCRWKSQNQVRRDDKVGTQTQGRGFQPEPSPCKLAHKDCGERRGYCLEALWTGQGAPSKLAFQLRSVRNLEFSDETSYRSSPLSPHIWDRNISISWVLYRQDLSLGVPTTWQSVTPSCRRGPRWHTIPGPSFNSELEHNVLYTTVQPLSDLRTSAIVCICLSLWGLPCTLYYLILKNHQNGFDKCGKWGSDLEL